jgi:hypothetical protein
VTGLQAPEIEDLIDTCQPFVEMGTNGRVRLFHPDFGRWLLAGNVTGLSEAAEHLKLAVGLTKFAASTQWGAVTTDYAAPWVLSHWCSLFILDPFHPEAGERERQVADILADVRWCDRAGGILDTVQQAGMVAPGLRLPGTSVLLSLGLRALRASDSVNSS